MRCIGKGAESAVMFCGIMNLPPPPTKFTKFNNILLQAARETCEESMAEAVHEAVEENEGGRDIAVAVDGSWQKRGFSSKNGVVTVTSVDTGKVIDVEILSKHCICPNKTKHLQNCKRNFVGYSGKMETTTTPEITPSAPGPALDMETSTTMDTNAPSSESLESFLESVRVDALRANLSSIQNSSDYLSITIFAENKLNCLSNFMFPDINVSNNISVDLIKIIEEARLKFSILKHQEMKDDLNQFTNLCQSWGIQKPATQTPFVLAKLRQRRNSLPGETSKKQKLEATTCQNKFSVLSIEDPPEELQIDEPLPPSPTPEKTTTKPKKKHGPSKKPASLANKQPPAPTPVITAAQIAQLSTSTATRSIRIIPNQQMLPKPLTAPPITIDNVVNSSALLRELQTITSLKL
ncbi:uncharacterized protein NPIL_15811 [Nephila pilipes]|uniref:Mutator-like transposase domain-containing protein n=1 Tax=Nephila pilipes TaxID=299642 RepID=A0A8X6PZ50_NEPPI|nr:uncharacterized protein NPIL_15811 [Nephila pilipes]